MVVWTKDEVLSWGRRGLALGYLIFAFTVFNLPGPDKASIKATLNKQDLTLNIPAQKPSVELDSQQLQTDPANPLQIPQQPIAIDVFPQDLTVTVPDVDLTTHLSLPPRISRLQELVKALSAPLALIFIAWEINQQYEIRQKAKEDQEAEDKRQKELLEDYFKSFLDLDALGRRNHSDREVLEARYRTEKVLKELRPAGQQEVINFLRRQRFTTPDINLDSPEILYKIDLEGIDFSGVDFSNTGLAEANLQKTILSNAIFIDANLADANLADAQLQGAKLQGAKLVQADFQNADLNSIKFDDATDWTDAKNLNAARNFQIGPGA